MRLVSKLFLTFGILLAITACSTLLSVWSARQATLHLERTHLAHKEYETYLSLSSHTYQLFKQFGDAMLIGDRDRGLSESALLGKLRADIAYIRYLIGQEIRLVGEEEIEELNRLAKIENKIEDLIVEYQAIVKSKNMESVLGYWERLSRMLDVKIDKDFNQLIQEAIQDEAEEVRKTREATKAKIQLFTNLAVLFALLAVIATMISLWMLGRDIKTPIEKLLNGAVALSRGELEHRINVTGPLELRNVSRAFNNMATEISTREMALSQANEFLEKTVTERTVDLERLLDTLKASEANRQRLLADVSHELRTPLTIIRGEAGIALRGQAKPPELYREALEKCRDAAEHTARLVDDLLFVARREAGETRLQFDSLNLTMLMPCIIEEYHNFIEEKNGTISFINMLDGEAIIRGDEGRIRQVILILLENALRYGGEQITVRLDRASSGYAVSVTDNGPGMIEEEQSLAFERFFRGSNATSRYGQGAGLGLPVAKAIVEAHSGKIALTSEPGQGLTVSFTLPTRPPLKAVS